MGTTRPPRNIRMAIAMHHNLPETVKVSLNKALGEPLQPGLYLVATPIGNLADITLRALTVLARADHICCENTRHSLKLLNHYGISGHLSAYHDHNAARERPKILAWLKDGASVALISDAGTPLISDPGYKLVREAVGGDIRIHPIPGPSAVFAGLAASGLPTDSFFFAGFLPPREAAARQRLETLADVNATLIFFETASRLQKHMPQYIQAFLGRDMVVGRELTKHFEEIIRLNLTVNTTLELEAKGEFVVLIGPPREKTASADMLKIALDEALGRMSVRDAVEEVRRTLRVPKREVYDLALEMRKGVNADDDGLEQKTAGKSEGQGS